MIKLLFFVNLFVSLLALDGLPAGGQTGLTNAQPRAGLPNVFSKLKAAQPVTIAYLGGSITAGAGASDSDKTSYRGLVGHWFTTTFPKAQVTNIDAAIGGTGSDLGAFRLDRDVMSKKPDLVFVEFAVNDGGASDAMIDRAMEGIVRQILRADPATDICFVYTFVVAQLPEFAAKRATRAVQRDETIAAYYGIPSVNMGVPAAQQLLENKLSKEAFTKDGVHPTDAGYQIYADTLIAFLETQRSAPEVPRPHALPKPLWPNTLEHAHMIGPDEIQPLGAGWTIETKSPAGKFSKLLVAEKPDATQTVSFSGPILAMFYLLGPDTGAFDYRIDQGAWQQMDPFDKYAKNYYRAHYRLLADGLADTAHTLTLKIRAEHHPDSKGTVTRIGYLLVNPSSPAH